MANTSAVEPIQLLSKTVTPEIDAYLLNALYGTSDRVINIGSNMAPTIVDNNTIRLADGLYCHQGFLIRIKPGQHEDLTIANGQTGYNRIDLIVANYTTDGVTATHTIEVVKGTATTGTAVAPKIISSDLHNGGVQDQSIIAVITLTGLTISSAVLKNPIRKGLQSALQFVSAD